MGDTSVLPIAFIVTPSPNKLPRKAYLFGYSERQNSIVVCAHIPFGCLNHARKDAVMGDTDVLGSSHKPASA